jgi:transposase
MQSWRAPSNREAPSVAASDSSQAGKSPTHGQARALARGEKHRITGRKVINLYTVGKHLDLDIQEDRFDFQINESRLAEEAALDGIYVVRTSVSPSLMAAAEVVHSYKRLGQIERAFRSLRTQELKVCPIFYRLEQRVRAHIFLYLLAYYVRWHMMEAWRPLLFSDEEHEVKASRNPVAPAERSVAARHKAAFKHLSDGSPVHSFRTLLQHLSTGYAIPASL